MIRLCELSIPLVLASHLCFAQTPSSPPRAPHPLGAVEARSTMTLSGVTRLFSLQGNVFVNEAAARRVLVFDAGLQNMHVVLDSALGKDNSYGRTASPAGLHRFRGDSAYMGASGSQEMVILAPTGAVARIAAPPQPGFSCSYVDMDDLGWLTCQPATGAGRMSLDEVTRRRPARLTHDSVVAIRMQDTAAVVSVQMSTSRTDTIGRVGMGFAGSDYTFKGPTSFSARTVVAPVVVQDGWTMFRDGTLAIAHATDYRIDIIAVKDPPIHGARVPFAWRAITAPQQMAIMDSLRRADSLAAVRFAARNDSIARSPGGGVTNLVLADGSTLTARVLSTGSLITPDYLPLDQWPTYWPPFYRETFAADEDNRLWLRERLAPEADTIKVYAVFNRKGELIDRVSVPMALTIRGFGAGGAVYMTAEDAGRTTLLVAHHRP